MTLPFLIPPDELSMSTVAFSDWIASACLVDGVDQTLLRGLLQGSLRILVLDRTRTEQAARGG